MKEKWYYFAGGIILSAAIFSFLSFISPTGEPFSSVPSTGFIVKEAIKDDLRASHDHDAVLVGYYEPFDGENNLPEKVVYKGVDYELRIVSFEQLVSSDGSEVEYLFSIGESDSGDFPVFFVRSGLCESLVVLDEPFVGNPIRS